MPQLASKRGFTLLEILIVLGVIFTLASIILPSFRGFQNEANITKAHSELSLLKAGVESYRRNNSGQLPDNITTSLIQTSPQLIMDIFSDPFATVIEPLAKSGFTYGYVTDNIAGYGDMYVLYSQGINQNGSVTWNREASVNVVVSLNNNAIAASNVLVR